MKNINEVQKLIGNTPLIKIKYNSEGKDYISYFKAEWYNLTGSIKDRVALSIIKNSYKDKTLHSGQEIVEVTSGNMGISLSAIGSYLGHKVTIFMPKNMTEERKKILLSYNAKLIEVQDFNEAFEKSKNYAQKTNAFLTKQFENIYNQQAHKTTAKEILKQTKGDFEGFISGVGTSGTLSGIALELKKTVPDLFVCAIEPQKSLLLSTGKSHSKHKLYGLADDIIPALYNKNLIDKIIQISDEDAIAMAQKISKQFGIGIGISGGANFIGVVLSGKNKMVSVFPDDNKKYLSTDLSKDITTPLVEKIKLIDYEVIK